MDSNASRYLLNHAALSSVYYQRKEDNASIIDLGLSLRVINPETYHPSPHDDGKVFDLNWLITSTFKRLF